MKIVIAGPIGSPGGLQTHFSELKNFLVSEKHEVLAIDVCLPGASPAKSNFPQIATATIADGGAFQKASSWIGACLKLAAFRPDVLIAVANGYGYCLLGLFAAGKCFSIRTEVTDSWEKGDKLHETMARIYDGTAVQSHGLLKALRTKISANHPLAILPCFTERMPQQYICRQPEDGEEIRLCYFGRLALNKGLIDLMEVIASDKALQARIKLDIWGSGPVGPALEELCREHDLLSVVRLKGRFPGGDEYFELLSSYHGLILPSQYSEGVPLVLLEAASVGLPFLSCDVGAIADCALENPDATVIPIGRRSLATELPLWINRLAHKRFEPARLKSWFYSRHSRDLQEQQWRSMLALKERFFNAEA